MSASETNTEKSAKRHRGPLIGIAIAVAVGLLMVVFMSLDSFVSGNDPEGAEQQIDGTGEVVPADDGVDAMIEAEGGSE